MEECLALQGIVYRVPEAVRQEVGAERMYVFTFGSNQGISHVHWHVAPCRQGWLMTITKGRRWDGERES